MYAQVVIEVAIEFVYFAFFDKGKLSTLTGATHPYDAAIVWSDSDTAFKVLSSRSDEQTFRAAADGKLKVDGMVAYVQWFTDGVKLAMK